MSLKFDASNEFISSLRQIDTLLHFAIAQRIAENDENRVLFLKLAIVSSVTKFQVFIEAILAEYKYLIGNTNRTHGQLSVQLRLTAIRIFSSQNFTNKTLENPSNYSTDKLDYVRDIATRTLSICNDDDSVSADIIIDTKFPLGKTGLNELTKLFKQVNGEDIFDSPPFDVNKLNEILGKRHAIVHEDSSSQVTEEKVASYKIYLGTVANYIDEYLSKY